MCVYIAYVCVCYMHMKLKEREPVGGQMLGGGKREIHASVRPYVTEE